MIDDTSQSHEGDVIEAAITELVIANRILAREQVIDDFGHVSIRHPLNPRALLPLPLAQPRDRQP